MVSRLAAEAGIEVPNSTLLRLAPTYGTFCARHFDRHRHARRLYASAMTLAGRHDNEDAGLPSEEIERLATAFLSP